MRTFIAFDLPDALRTELQAASQRLQRKLAAAPLRWVAADSIHLTLKFLGEIEEGQVAAVVERLQAAAASIAPLEISLTQLGAFPTAQRPRVLWAGLRAPAALGELQLAVEVQLAQLGFPPEGRPFTPHLTLARAQRDARPAQLAAVAPALAAESLEPLTAALREITLFQSQLNRGGAVYNPLVRIHLADK